MKNQIKNQFSRIVLIAILSISSIAASLTTPLPSFKPSTQNAEAFGFYCISGLSSLPPGNYTAKCNGVNVGLSVSNGNITFTLPKGWNQFRGDNSSTWYNSANSFKQGYGVGGDGDKVNFR